jgi:DNA-binding FadR family transcriptional regulator
MLKGVRDMAANRKHDQKGRSTGKLQGNKRTKIQGQFIATPADLVSSPAIRVLSLAAHRVLRRIEAEHAAHGGAENGQLPVTYDDFVRFGVHRHSIRPAINELVALGLIEITDKGRAGNAEFRRPNKFRLTYLSTARDGPTNEWSKIESLEAASEIAREAREKTKPQ